MPAQNKKISDERRFSAKVTLPGGKLRDLEWTAGSLADLTGKRREYHASRSVSALLNSTDICSDGGNVRFKCIRGPIGDGKSVGCCMYIVKKAQEQVVLDIFDPDEPGVRKKIRWSKCAIVRHTFKALEETTIETWNQWFGDKTVWTKNPYCGRYEELLDDGTLCRIDFVCYASESRNILSDLDSLELTMAWVNEACYTPYTVVSKLYSRLKRFNPAPMAGVDLKTYHIVMDTNAPPETNWWHDMEVVKKPSGWLFIVCPPAMLREVDPATGAVKFVPNNIENAKKHNRRPAENVREIDGGYHRGMSYWSDLAGVLTDDEFKRKVLNEFGTSIDGQGVWVSYDPARHRLPDRDMPIQRGMTVAIGLDLGRTPAASIAQMGPDGVVYVKREATTWDPRLNNGRGGLAHMDVGTFWERKLRPVLVETFGYPGIKTVCFADPAGKNFNEVVSISAIDLLRSKGLDVLPCDKVQPAASGIRDITEGNNVGIRVQCVEEALKQGLVKVSDSCTMLCEALSGKYCYPKRRAASSDGSEQYGDSPDKNDWSHIADSFQYLCLALFKGAVDYSRPVEYMCCQDGFGEWGNPVGAALTSTSGIDFGCL